MQSLSVSFYLNYQELFKPPTTVCSNLGILLASAYPTISELAIFLSVALNGS